MKVVLAGPYPAGTADKIRRLLPSKRYKLIEAASKESYDATSDADILILRTYNADQDAISRIKNLKIIMRWGVGYDSVDLKSAGEKGILVTNTPGANSEAVSELAVMMMLSIGRQFVRYIECVHSGNWSPNTFVNTTHSLNNKLVGIIGGGNIGKLVARKVQAFGAKVQYYDVFRLPEEKERELGMQFADLDTLIRTSDIVSLHVPLFESNYHMIGEKELASMKDGAILINTARGGLVDDNALAEAVASGKLAGAGLDVVEETPLPEDSPLLKDPRILLTPHIGGSTADIPDAIIPILAEDIRDWDAGKELKHVVNRQYLA